MLKLPWPLLKVNLRILGLVGRGATCFVQNKTTIILRGDTGRTTSELPCRTKATHFWRQIRSLKTQNVSYFSLLQSDTVLGTINYFSWKFIPSPVRKVAWFQLLSCKLTMTSGFSACWILIGQFKFQARQPYARYMPRGFLRMSRRVNGVRNSRYLLCFWPTTRRVFVCCNFA